MLYAQEIVELRNLIFKKESKNKSKNPCYLLLCCKYFLNFFSIKCNAKKVKDLMAIRNLVLHYN